MICPICKTDQLSMRGLLVHILVIELLKAKVVPADDSLLVRHCYCGKRFEYDMTRRAENAIMDLKAHICGRRGAGVSEDNITMDEINAWPCYYNWLMGVK